MCSAYYFLNSISFLLLTLHNLPHTTCFLYLTSHNFHPLLTSCYLLCPTYALCPTYLLLLPSYNLPTVIGFPLLPATSVLTCCDDQLLNNPLIHYWSLLPYYGLPAPTLATATTDTTSSTYCLLPIIYHLQPTTCDLRSTLLPTTCTCCPTTYYLLPTIHNLCT